MAIQNRPYEQGGILGPNAQGLIESLRGPTAQVDAPPIQADAPVAPNYKQTGQYLGNRYKNEKSQQPWDQMTERYKIGTVLSHFDPNQGLTPDVIKALNEAGILSSGQFSGEGQRLTAPGVDRFGTGGTDDIIHKFQGGGKGNAQWAAWTSPEGQAKQRAINAQRRGQAQMPGGPAMRPGGISGMLQGDAFANIQQALSQVQQPGMLQQLIAALGGQ